MTVPVDGGEPSLLAEIAGARAKLFAFDDPRDRIDYLVLSPDGHTLLFDVLRPSGGDIWSLEGL